MESKKFIERAAEVLYQAGKNTKEQLKPTTEEANSFLNDINNLKNSKKISDLFDKNAKAILEKIKKHK